MMARLFLHIGAPKTGTTSLQSLLEVSYKQLLEHGVLYPRLGLEEPCLHHVFTRPFCAARPNDGIWSVRPQHELMTQDEILRRLAEEVERTGAHTIVISSEVFFCLSAEVFFRPHDGIEVASAAKDMFAAYDTTILLYLRRQDRWLESCYIEAVKGPHTLTSDEVTEFDLFLNREKLDYVKQIIPWQKAFGEEKIRVRSYDRVRKADGVLSAFFRDIELPGFVEKTADNRQDNFINISPPPAGIELFRRMNEYNNAFPKENGSQGSLRLDEVSDAFSDLKDQRFLSASQCRELLSELHDSNVLLDEIFDLDYFGGLRTSISEDDDWPVLTDLDLQAVIKLIRIVLDDRSEAWREREEIFETSERHLAERNDLYDIAERRLSDLNELHAVAEQRLEELKSKDALAHNRQKQIHELQNELSNWEQQPVRSWWRYVTRDKSRRNSK